MKNKKQHTAKKTNKYQIAIISFFDILGFGAMVNKSKSPEKIKSILDTLQRSAKQDEDLAKSYEQSFINFSDTAIRLTNVESDINKNMPFGVLYWELLDLIYIQFDLIWKRNIFLRGSITIDTIYHDENYIFGSGLNRAYKLEKNIAIYPRIIIDPQIFRILEQTYILKAQHHDIEEEKGYIKDLVRVSSDGIWFLDYLKFMASEVDNKLQYGDFLSHHKKLIIKYAKKFEDLDEIAHKYNWLAQYHNEVINSFDDYFFDDIGLSRTSLLITKKDIKTYYEF
jgi:hypothetical protein